MVIRFLQLVFWDINFRSAYARFNFWYYLSKLFGKLTFAACNRAEEVDGELDDLMEVLHGIADQP